MGKPSMKNMITYLAIVSMFELYTNLRESRVTGSLFLMVIFTVFRWVFIATSTPVIVPCTWCYIVSNLWRERAEADNRAFRIHQSKWQEWTVLFSNPTEKLCWTFFFTWVPFFISMVTVSWESFIRNRTNFILAEMCLRSETEQIVAEKVIIPRKAWR